ncbi:hypothetical protein GQ54DRAFT_166460 [Martensiomyces pterosporus]|nr:hypothetical protein GQ54DRAFT_166460 [Martensiomyces pterosporus]
MLVSMANKDCCFHRNSKSVVHIGQSGWICGQIGIVACRQCFSSCVELRNGFSGLCPAHVRLCVCRRSAARLPFLPFHSFSTSFLPPLHMPLAGAFASSLSSSLWPSVSTVCAPPLPASSCGSLLLCLLAFQHFSLLAALFGGFPKKSSQHDKLADLASPELRAIVGCAQCSRLYMSHPAIVGASVAALSTHPTLQDVSEYLSFHSPEPNCTAAVLYKYSFNIKQEIATTATLASCAP